MRVEPAAGPLALGCQGPVRDRLTPPGRVEGFRPRELYSIAALARWAPFRAPFFMPPLAAYGQALTGLRVLKFYGAIAPRVLKFDSGYAAEGCGGRL